MGPFEFKGLRLRDDDDDERDSGDDHESVLGTGAIAGIAVGAVIILIAIGLLVYCIRRRKKQRNAKAMSNEQGQTKQKSSTDNVLLQPHSARRNRQDATYGQPFEQQVSPKGQTGNRDQTPLSPVPAYSKNTDLAWNPRTGKRESELDGAPTSGVDKATDKDKTGGSSQSATQTSISDIAATELEVGGVSRMSNTPAISELEAEDVSARPRYELPDSSTVATSSQRAV